MESMLTQKSLSLTELKDPVKAFVGVGDSPVTLLNDNTVLGYFIPKSAIENMQNGYSDNLKLQKIIDESIMQNQQVLDYLKDK
jgi:antitoxin StbD